MGSLDALSYKYNGLPCLWVLCQVCVTAEHRPGDARCANGTQIRGWTEVRLGYFCRQVTDQYVGNKNCIGIV